MKKILLLIAIVAATITACKKDEVIPDKLEVTKVRSTSIILDARSYYKDEFFISSPTSVNVASVLSSDQGTESTVGDYQYSYVNRSIVRRDPYNIIIDNGRERIIYQFVRK